MTDRPESYRQTLARLAGAQKAAARSAPAYSRYVNRRLGRLLAAWAYRAGLTPDAVTGISAAFTYSGIAVLALTRPTWWTGVLIGTLLVIGYAFDSADGQVARLRGGGTPAGEWLDHVVDALKVVTLPLALLVGFARAGVVDTWWLLVPLASAIVSSVLFLAMILTEQLRRAAGTASIARDEAGRPSWVRSVLVIPTDYGLLCLSFLLLGALPVFQVLYTVVTAATAGFLALALVKWFRELQELGGRS
ncbi:CDP-alcohol phosphatidyltransferase family protein [Isoptericola sp. b441]|uniref:CDP-alcohol phosphatidyltransferase family protein n=1 Tax=Actinotalea lenta TaxID=3064654 RepID=A0ABT9D8M5_9CELL|nr:MULTISPECIES: CDP-alcohol phosphatidyltransferase family protein [unclassified Isoptericola]MDO8106806.1 CDP-alcohol phosphatidyltransferase family protein [Isoptericola sp. b441]MDO8121483.1 CDP-alcohol phosphatidyltransferase family protein [Isoptericola sp. b490]